MKPINDELNDLEQEKMLTELGWNYDIINIKNQEDESTN